jgi:hypothetical protein
VAIDVRGYGDSFVPDTVEAYRMLAHVADNVAVVRGLGADTAVVVGEIGAPRSPPRQRRFAPTCSPASRCSAFPTPHALRRRRRSRPTSTSATSRPPVSPRPR